MIHSICVIIMTSRAYDVNIPFRLSKEQGLHIHLIMSGIRSLSLTR